MPAVGFTGTRKGCTPAQLEALARVLAEWLTEPDATFHHGCCVGADAQAVALVRKYVNMTHVVAHPGDWPPLQSSESIASSNEVLRCCSGLRVALEYWGSRDGTSVPQTVRAHLLRDIVGNPHRPVAMEYRYNPCPYCGAKGWHGPKADDDDTVWCRECHKPRSLGRFYCPWLTPTVVGLAHAAYDSRDEQTGHLNPVRLAVLADALEEAGCAGEECPRCRGTGELSCPKCSGEGCSPYGVGANGRCTAGDPCPGCGGTGWLPHPLLAHLRGPGPHVRGCWAIDLITGRE